VLESQEAGGLRRVRQYLDSPFIWSPAAWQDPSRAIQPWYAITGQTQVIVNAADLPPSDDGQDEVMKTIAHELGHALALGDRLTCGNGVRPSLMQQQEPDCRSSTITDQDRADYAEIYTPGRVSGFSATRGAEPTVTFTWNPGAVHVESGFEIQRALDSTFNRSTRTGSVFPNIGSLTVGSQPLGQATYRVVSTTLAFGNAAPALASVSGEYTLPAAKATTNTRVTCWDGSKAASPAACPADTRVTCWDGSKAASKAACPADTRVTCWDGSKAASKAACPADTRVTCWDGSKAASLAACPTDTRVTCWDGSKAASPAACPTDTRVTCWDGSKAASPAACPADTRVTCWNGQKVTSRDQCPPEPRRCFDPFFNEVPCPPVDPCLREPHFPGCSQQEDPPDSLPGPPEARLPDPARVKAVVRRRNTP
jgi:hypothetical protein